MPTTPDAFDLASISARLSRLRRPVSTSAEGPRAAVAAILREGSLGAEVLLIRRAERPGDPWSGHMAFPGGRRDYGDSDLLATAVRETREEVGVDLDAHGVLLGQLADLDAVARARRTGLVITPFVFALTREVPLASDAGEVAEALWAPLAPLARGEGAGTVPWEIEGRTLELPCWRIDGRVVWGLTYRMLQTLFEALPRMILWAISDLHVGHRKNREALAELPSFGSDWLIVAGDVGETEAHLELALSELCRRFARVLWVPGNHELWTVSEDGARGQAKYDRLVAICRRHGALTPEDPWPRWIGEGGPRVIAPLFVLYDYSFRPDDVPEEGAVAWAEETGVLCSDEHLLHPDPHPSIPAWCAARVAVTERRLAELDPATRVVLVNHFPLDERLLKLWLIPRFSIWCGTRRTGDWHLRHPVDTVVYGHTHQRATDWLDGVRFEEVSLGYPRDWSQEAGVQAYLRQILPAPASAWEEPPSRSPPSPPPGLEQLGARVRG